MKLAVLGAGAWGTSLAAHAAGLQPTCLWARDEAQAAAIEASRRNPRYLAGVVLPPGLRIVSDLHAALDHARGGLVIVATPMAGLEAVLRSLPDDLAGVLWACKGLDPGSGRLGHEIARDVAPRLRAGVLSGPSFAIEVARGQPTALVAASRDPGLAEFAVAALHGGNLRIYTSADPVGVEVGGAVKNVLAIATGIADGMPVWSEDTPGTPDDVAKVTTGLGLNARAALVTRGLAEMTRLGVALGGEAATFMGLSGLGDLVLTATGPLSRNREVGLQLARGRALATIMADLGHVAEGVPTAPMLLRRAAVLGVDMPITAAVVAVLNGQATPTEALERLMGRDARPER